MRSLEKVALVLPASFTGFPAEVATANRSYLERLRGLVADEDIDGIVDLMLSREPAEVAQMLPARAWTKAKAENLIGTDMSDGLGLALETAVDDTAEAAENLRAFPGEILVAHPRRQFRSSGRHRRGDPSCDPELPPRGAAGRFDPVARASRGADRILGEFFG